MEWWNSNKVKSFQTRTSTTFDLKVRVGRNRKSIDGQEEREKGGVLASRVSMWIDRWILDVWIWIWSSATRDGICTMMTGAVLFCPSVQPKVRDGKDPRDNSKT